MIQDSLKQLGLTEKETEIYLALLPLGQAPASTLSIRTGIPRTTAKFICEQLSKKRLIEGVESKNTVLYSAKSPNELLAMVNDEKKELKRKEETLNFIISDLHSLYSPHATLPKIKFFEGVDGLIELISDSLKEAEPLYGALTITDEMHPDIAAFHQKEYIPRRKELGNKSFMIFNDNEKTMEYRKHDAELKRTAMLVPYDQFPFDSCLHIYKDKIAFYSYNRKDLSGVLIRNETLNKSQFSIFKMAWNYARTLSVNKQYKDYSL